MNPNPENPAADPLSPSPGNVPSRRGSPHIKVWLLPAEKAVIQKKAKGHSLSDSAYLRAVGMAMPIKSTLDQESILELARINGDLGRLGGLLKLWLTNQDHAMDRGRLESLLGSIEATQTLLARKADSLAAKPHA